jgi:ABC-type multidrug transport system fused ATPase/permease subunit
MASWLHDFAEMLIGQYIKLQGGYHTRSYLTSLVNIAIVFLRDGGAYIYLILKAVESVITPGDFVLYFNAIGQFANFVAGIINIWSTIQTASLQFNDYRAFEDLENRTNRGRGVNLPEYGPLSIDIENLSYIYPKSVKAILRNINLHIAPGEKLAVVGLNGAGKTTLIKLICGMYTPTEGRISVNNHEVNEYNRDEYYTMFSAVFQYFRYLPLSISKNIAPGDEEINYDKLNRCIALSGFKEKVDNLPDGIDTPLVKSINPNATELSGGEAQKLMLARALYKEAPILILDEPTAALDPIAESELYQKYNSLTANKTSIYISHRLASTRFCDRIVLIDDGEIVEMGTHDELLLQNGKYANLFNIQSHYYKENVEERL